MLTQCYPRRQTNQPLAYDSYGSWVVGRSTTFFFFFWLHFGIVRIVFVYIISLYMVPC